MAKKFIKVLGLLTVSLMFILGMIFIRGTANATRTSEVEKVQSLVKAALNYEMRRPILSDADYSKLKTNDGLEQIKEKMYSSVSDYYSGSEASEKKHEADVVVSQLSAGNVRDLDGGVSDLTFKKTSINGNFAEIVAVADLWSKAIGKEAGNWITSEPKNKVQYHMILQKDNSGNWKITSEDFSFVQGYGP